MKIVTKDNFNRDLFVETVVAEKLNQAYGEEIVELLNAKHWGESSNHYFALVEDNYEPYDGYAELM